MPDIDPFIVFRWDLFVVVSIYCTIVTVQQGWSWYVWLTTSDRYIGILRQYVIVHGLRLRFKTFWGDVIICLLLCVVFMILFWAHTILIQIDRTLT